MLEMCSQLHVVCTIFCLRELVAPPARWSPPCHWQHKANNRGNCCILQPQAAVQLSNSRLNDNSIHTHTHSYTRTHTCQVTWQLHGLAVPSFPLFPLSFPWGCPAKQLWLSKFPLAFGILRAHKMQIMPEINVDKLFMLPAAFVGTLRARERERKSKRKQLFDAQRDMLRLN